MSAVTSIELCVSSDATNAEMTGGDVSPTIIARAFKGAPFVVARDGDDVLLRRLTPLECERLQGFPDGHTTVSWRGKPMDACPDGPRYKALGNSMAVPVMRWIGRRIETVDALLREEGT